MIRLLLLEDNEGDARLEQAALAEYAPGEFLVTRVERLQQALARIDAEAFDVVLSDIGLPDSVEMEAVQAIVAHAPALPLVVLTGSHDAELGRLAILHGAQDFLIKGESGGALIARTLHYAIERKRLETSLRDANETLERRVVERTATLEQVVGSLRSSEERFRAVTQSANDAIVTADGAGTIVGWNTAAERIFGYTEAEASGLPLTMLMPERYRERHRAGFNLALSADAQLVVAKTVELEGRRKDGREFPMELARVKCRIAEGWMFTGFIRDITERKQAEAQRKLAAEVFEQSSEGIMITDAECNIVLVNHAFTTITGYGEADVLGRNPRMLASGRQGRDFYRAMWDSINRTGRWEGELWNCRKDGRLFPEWLSISRMLDTSGAVSHYIGTFVDTTQSKAAAEQIQ